MDLTGYGPSQILESTEQSIQAHKKAAAAYRQTAETYRRMANRINEAAPRIAAQQRHAAERLKVLNHKTAKVHQTARKVLKGDTRSLAELNTAIQKQERINRRPAAELKRWQAKVRKLNAK